MRKVCILFLLPLSVWGQSNLVKNGSFESSDPTNLSVAQYWQGTFGRVSLPDNWDGAWRAELSSGQSATQKIVLNQSVYFPVRISVRIRGEGIQNDPADKYGANLQCKVVRKDGSISWCPTTLKTKNVDTFWWRWAGYNTSSLSSSTSPIDYIEVKLNLGVVAGKAWFDDVHIEEWPPTHNGLLTYVFDDSFLTSYSKAYPMMKGYGMVGTAAITTNYLANPTNRDGIHMTLAELKEMYAGGWSVMSHTVTHPDLSTATLQTLNNEIYWSRKFLQDNGMTVEHLALPFGGYNALVLTRAQVDGYKSVRSSDRGMNPPGAFPYNIYVRPVTSSTTLTEVNAWIADAKDTKSWLVLLLHEIDRENGIYTVSTPMFQSILSAVAISGVEVVTYDEGFRRTAVR